MVQKAALISGGGIGGLCTAIALARDGFSVDIVEQAEKFSEVGAGIQIGPNASRILHHWGLQDSLIKAAVQPGGISIINGKNNNILTIIPLGQMAEKLFGFPYYVIHRSDLQNLLLEAVSQYPQISLTNNFEVASFEHSATSDRVTVTSTVGIQKQAHLVIGADGLWSAIRNQIIPDYHPIFSGLTAWRGLIPVSEVPAQFQSQNIQLYLGPYAHLVMYPVKGGSMMNIVAVLEDDWSEPGWNQTGQYQQINDFLTSWHRDIRSFLESVSVWKKWALFELETPKNWTSGNICLLGDAAHPMLPFLAQGGAMAIEDAASIAFHLRSSATPISLSLLNYQKDRQKRALRIQKNAKRVGRIYHYKHIMALARNYVISRRNPISLLKDYNWLYGAQIKM